MKRIAFRQDSCSSGSVSIKKRPPCLLQENVQTERTVHLLLNDLRNPVESLFVTIHGPAAWQTTHCAWHGPLLLLEEITK